MPRPPSDSAERPARRGRPPRTSREELVGAALAVIAREGVAATTTRKIADEAGVPLGAVHYWFTDKAALLEEVVRAMLRRLEETASTLTLEGEADYQDALVAIFRTAAGEDLGAQIGLYELTAYALRTPGLRELAARQYALYRDTAQRLVALAMADSGLPAETVGTLGELVAVTFDGAALAWLADPEGADPERVLALLAHLVTTLRAMEGTPGD